MIDINLNEEFCRQVKTFFGSVIDLLDEIEKVRHRHVRVEVSFRTCEHPHILQSMIREFPSDLISEGNHLSSKIYSFLQACESSGIMSVAQADIANKKLDRLRERLRVFREAYPEEQTQALLFLPLNRNDFCYEAEEFPLAQTQAFLKELAYDYSKDIETVTITWRRPDPAALKKMLPYGVPSQL